MLLMLVCLQYNRNATPLLSTTLVVSNNVCLVFANTSSTQVTTVNFVRLNAVTMPVHPVPASGQPGVYYMDGSTWQVGEGTAGTSKAITWCSTVEIKVTALLFRLSRKKDSRERSSFLII